MKEGWNCRLENPNIRCPNAIPLSPLNPNVDLLFNWGFITFGITAMLSSRLLPIASIRVNR